jgi:hypothetical protein
MPVNPSFTLPQRTSRAFDRKVGQSVGSVRMSQYPLAIQPKHQAGPPLAQFLSVAGLNAGFVSSDGSAL